MSQQSPCLDGVEEIPFFHASLVPSNRAQRISHLWSPGTSVQLLSSNQPALNHQHTCIHLLTHCEITWRAEGAGLSPLNLQQHRG